MTTRYDSVKFENYFRYFECLEGFSEANVRAIKKSVRNMKLQEVEPSTIRSYLSHLKAIAPMIDFEIYNASRKELEDLAMDINEERHSSYGPEEGEYSDWTRADHKSSIQTFFKYFFDDDKDHLFQNIRSTPKSSDCPTLDPEELIKTREAERLIEAVDHIRDKAFLALLWDSGMRRKEIAEIRWKDVVPQGNGVVKIHVRNGKNGPRTIFLYESSPWINAWFSEYPKPESDDSLWISKKNNAKKEVSTRTLGNIVRKAEKQADIPERRKTNLHAFRKARATDMASKGMNQPAMEDYFGWCRGSRMPRIYIQLASTDLENQVREIYGLQKRERNQEIIGEDIRRSNEEEGYSELIV